MSMLSVITPITITEAMLTSSTVPEADYATWASGTTYASGDRVIYLHRIYESTAGSNVGYNPLTDDAEVPWWIDIGPTNRWACLDSETSTVTTRAASLSYVMTPGRFATLALIDMQATSVYVKIESVVDGVVYEQTHAIKDTSALPDWYRYFYNAIKKPKELIIENLAPIGDVTVTITVANAYGDASLGTLVFGWSYEIGEVTHGARAGIIDYSRKETDDFGVTSFVRRAYAKRAELSLTIAADQVDYIAAVLSELRATPCLWRGDDGGYTLLTVFGFYRDFSIDIQYPTFSVCTLTLEGLI